MLTPAGLTDILENYAQIVETKNEKPHPPTVFEEFDIKKMRNDPRRHPRVAAPGAEIDKPAERKSNDHHTL